MIRLRRLILNLTAYIEFWVVRKFLLCLWARWTDYQTELCHTFHKRVSLGWLVYFRAGE